MFNNNERRNKMNNKNRNKDNLKSLIRELTARELGIEVTEHEIKRKQINVKNLNEILKSLVWKVSNLKSEQ